MKRLALLLALALATVIAVPVAVAQVRGATYTGTHNAGRGGTATLKLSDDGKRVVSYSFPEVAGDVCSFVGRGDEGVWEGADIQDGAFSYHLFEAIVLDGRFDGRTATGTLRLRTRGPSACDTGVVEWSVATPGTDPPPLPGATPTPTPVPSAPADTRKPSAGARRTVRTKVTLRRRSSRSLAGKVTSSESSCRSKRKVTLVRGKRLLALARTTTKRDGSFTFKRSSKTRHQQLRAIVTAASTPALICTAVTSANLRG